MRRTDLIAGCVAALLLGAGCATSKKKPSVAEAPPPVPVAGTDLDQHNVEKIRTGETLKAYPIGRYVDPGDPNVMHESHVVYRKESGANWNLAPNAPTVVPLGPVLAVSDGATQPNPLPAELEQKVAEQNQLMAALIEQNEALAAELTKLSKELTDLRRRAVDNSKTEEARP
ncbi:hypothetical protein OH491_16680 [Termitidicoccus mucosus]|uniref:Uncharacterized protein n=1 Tax=Termitidicoccus mucosus TaxID=1184151 RepID=A0A178IIY8_9BACT|nr:hypothetical protein AW736_11900 [Opitutaceae bacterium TSB47]